MTKVLPTEEQTSSTPDDLNSPQTEKQPKQFLRGFVPLNLFIVATISMLIFWGYVVVALNSGVVVGGSIDTISGDGLNSTHIFDITSRNAGKLMRQFYTSNNNTFLTLPNKMKLTSDTDGTSYIITPYKYTLENMEWNIFFVLYESDVTEALVMTTSISIGVTFNR